MSLDEITKWVFKDEERRGVGTEHPNWRAGRPPKEAGKQGQWDRGKPGEWSPGAKEGSICRRREGPAVHHVLLRVKSKETELTTGLGSMKVFGDLDKGLPHVAFREKGRGRGHSEVSRRAPKGTAEWASWRGTWEAQDAKWAGSGPRNAPSALSSALAGPWARIPVWWPSPYPGPPTWGEGYPSPLQSFVPPSL